MSKFMAVLMAVALSVSACSTQTIRDTEKLSGSQERDASKTVASIERSTKKSIADANSTSETNDGVWLGGHIVMEARHVDLPPDLVKTVSVNDKFMTLTELSDRLASIIDIPVRLAPEVNPYPVSATKGSSGGMGIAPAMGIAPGMGLPGGGVPATGGAGPLPGGMPGMPGGMGSMHPVHIDYGGPAAGLLDVVSSRFGTHWKYVDGAILFYNLETRTFELDAIPGDSALAANVIGGGQSGSSGGSSGSSGGASSGGGAGGSSGGAGGAPGGSASSGDASGSQTSVTSTLSVWTDIKSAVNSMLSSSGKAVITPSTGTIMVTDDPVYVARIAKYVEQENEILSKQVLLEVKVLSISRTDADQYGINWNAVFNSLSKNAGITATNTFPTGPGVGSLALNVLSTAGAGNPNANIRQFAGSGAVIDALSTQGKVSLVTSSTIVTLNNQPVPIQVGTQTSYLASVSNTVTANVGTTSSLTPGVIQTGFNMNLLPHLLDGRRVMLQFSVNISSLKNLNTVSSGGNTIQIPEVDSRDFLQRVSMRSGETLLLSGFEQTTANLNKQGIGSADNTALGGGVSASRTRDIVVIMITPVIARKAVHEL